MSGGNQPILHSLSEFRYWELPGWKVVVARCCSIGLAVIMLAAGLWKCSDPIAAAERLHQALVPAALSLPLALVLGISETVSGVWLLLRRYQRWGAWLSVLLLIAFLVYIGINYDRLRGDECNCFPWIQRAVGPGFFVGDGIMLVMALVAARWSQPSEGVRGATLIAGAVVVFALVSLGVSITQSGARRSPEAITVAGQTVSLQQGRFFIYFFDPECTHCLFAAQDLRELRWAPDVRIVGVPTERPELAGQFLEAAGWSIPLSPDVQKLRAVYHFGDPPYAVGIVDGRTAFELRSFEGDNARQVLIEHSFVAQGPPVNP